MGIMTSTKSSNLFITGCDHNTQWQLPWFVENFKKHNPNAELLIFDFGMNDAPFSNITKKHTSQDKGWFIMTSTKSSNTLRIDLLDNTTPKNIKVMHWTGAKGNDHIRGLL